MTLSSIKDRALKAIRETRTSRWIRFGIVAALFIFWVAWVGCWWALILLPLLFDIYITGFIPLTWWKKSKSPAVRMVMSWVDAILYALILVYFIFTFVGQNYQIPSASLEKTLLTGDYLWVNKISYGPRVPITPIHFPLVQNTLPVFNTKSYTEWPKWPYHRLKGTSQIEAGDIVVFNFPAGDTVATKVTNPDYYTLVRMYGRDAIAANPQHFGEVVYRPVDRRENYVKRAVGLPGDTLSIRDGYVYINSDRQPWPKEAQFNYIFQTSSPMTAADWERIEAANLDRTSIAPNLYLTSLTDEHLATLKAMPKVIAVERMPVDPEREDLFPQTISEQWTHNDYGPLWIPRRGVTVQLTAQNWPLYERIIRNYEEHPDAYLGADGRVYIDGRPASTYTFAMDYYFMIGDNRDNSLDSRFWGFVPEDHIVGKPMRVLISFDPDKSIFSGGIRWNRIFKNANPGF
ncbi:MAG: signal peptidase I [Muribaculaceae bacterium]|nr:signal peptidase I [Muribaculaceae bacterium]